MKHLNLILFATWTILHLCACDKEDNDSLNKTRWIYTNNYQEGVENEEILEFKRSTFQYTIIKKTHQNDGSIHEEVTYRSTGDYAREGYVVYLIFDPTGRSDYSRLSLSETGDKLFYLGVIGKEFIKQ